MTDVVIDVEYPTLPSQEGFHEAKVIKEHLRNLSKFPDSEEVLKHIQTHGAYAPVHQTQLLPRDLKELEDEKKQDPHYFWCAIEVWFREACKANNFAFIQSLVGYIKETKPEMSPYSDPFYWLVGFLCLKHDTSDIPKFLIDSYVETVDVALEIIHSLNRFGQQNFINYLIQKFPQQESLLKVALEISEELETNKDLNLVEHLNSQFRKALTFDVNHNFHAAIKFGNISFAQKLLRSHHKNQIDIDEKNIFVYITNLETAKFIITNFEMTDERITKAFLFFMGSQFNGPTFQPKCILYLFEYLSQLKKDFKPALIKAIQMLQGPHDGAKFTNQSKMFDLVNNQELQQKGFWTIFTKDELQKLNYDAYCADPEFRVYGGLNNKIYFSFTDKADVCEIQRALSKHRAFGNVLYVVTSDDDKAALLKSIMFDSRKQGCAALYLSNSKDFSSRLILQGPLYINEENMPLIFPDADGEYKCNIQFLSRVIFEGYSGFGFNLAPVDLRPKAEKEAEQAANEAAMEQEKQRIAKLTPEEKAEKKFETNLGRLAQELSRMIGGGNVKIIDTTKFTFKVTDPKQPDLKEVKVNQIKTYTNTQQGPITTFEFPDEQNKQIITSAKSTARELTFDELKRPSGKKKSYGARQRLKEAKAMADAKVVPATSTQAKPATQSYSFASSVTNFFRKTLSREVPAQSAAPATKSSWGCCGRRKS